MCRAREGTRIGHDICRGRCADLAARRGAQHEGDAIRRLLAATPPFAEWRQRDLGLLATAARVVQTGRGAELFAARAPAESIYLVEEGFLALYQLATTSLRPRGGGVASASAAGAPPLPRLRGGGGGTRCECAVAGSVGVAGRGSILGLDVVALPPGAAGAAPSAASICAWKAAPPPSLPPALPAVWLLSDPTPLTLLPALPPALLPSTLA